MKGTRSLLRIRFAARARARVVSLLLVRSRVLWSARGGYLGRTVSKTLTLLSLTDCCAVVLLRVLLLLLLPMLRGARARAPPPYPPPPPTRLASR